MRHLGDITKISGYTAPVVDCIIGGSPCQDLSVAGKRAGLDGERSGLYIEQVRIVKEMREQDERNGRAGVDIRPRYMVWENVPGAFSSNKGDDFRIVLEELAKVKDPNAYIPMPDKWTNHGCIMGDGWSIAWRVLDAQFWGTSDKPLPQRRRRIALVADFGGQSAPEILFVRKSVSGHTDESEPKRKATSSNASRGIGADDSIGVDIYNTTLTGDVVCPLTSGGITSTGTCPKVMTPVTFEPGIASREGGHIYEGVSGTLRANAGDNQMATAYSVENHPNDSRVGINEDGKVQALTSRMGTGGGNVPLVMESKANFIDVELETVVRKYDVNKKLLQECLRDHKGNFTNKEIAEALGKPLTLVEHWFRRDNSFAIPDADIWLKLKELLGIETTEFDQSVMEFEVKGSNYDMRNRIHVGNTVPTLTCGSGNNLHLLPMVLALDRASFNQGKNAQFNFEVSDKGVNSPLVAKGPGAVCYSVNHQGGNVEQVIEGKAGTLTASMNSSGNNKLSVCYGINGDKAGTLDASYYKGCGMRSGVEREVLAVDCRNATEDIVNGALQSNSAHSLNGNNVVRTRYIVRRLTPLECERLQGYPDGWTDIGEWVDSNCK